MARDLGAGVGVDGYRIDGVVGRGRHTVVYAARALDTGRDVVLKVFPGVRLGPAAFDRFFDQCKLPGAAGRHPNLVMVHDVVRTATGEACVVMAAYPGPTLAERRADVPLAVEEALAIAAEVADGLHAAHSLRPPAVHGNLSPDKILLADDGVARVAISDFGLAPFRGSPDWPDTERRPGPDRHEPHRRPTPHDDIHAVGTMLSGLLHGESHPAGWVIEKATAPGPANRFTTAAALRDALVAAGAPLPPAVRKPGRRTLPQWRSREVLLPMVVAAIGVLVIMAFALSRSDDAVDGPVTVRPDGSGTAPHDLRAEARGTAVALTWTDPGGPDPLFVVEAPVDGLRAYRGAVPLGAERHRVTDLDPERGYCFWLVLPYEGSEGDAIAISNPACVRGATPE